MESGRRLDGGARATDLGDEVVMVGQVCAAVDTAVATVAGVQVGLEGLGLGQLHHV